MLLKEAVAKLEDGQYASTGIWTEHSCQWFLHDGQLYWTAGHTTGGLANDTTHNPFQSKDYGYEIYDGWKGEPIKETK